MIEVIFEDGITVGTLSKGTLFKRNQKGSTDVYMVANVVDSDTAAINCVQLSGASAGKILTMHKTTPVIVLEGTLSLKALQYGKH